MSEKRTILIYGNFKEFHYNAIAIVNQGDKNVYIKTRQTLKTEFVDYIFTSDPNSALTLIYNDYRHSSYMELIAGIKNNQTELLENMEFRKGLHCG